MSEFHFSCDCSSFHCITYGEGTGSFVGYRTIISIQNHFWSDVYRAPQVITTLQKILLAPLRHRCSVRLDNYMFCIPWTTSRCACAFMTYATIIEVHHTFSWSDHLRGRRCDAKRRLCLIRCFSLGRSSAVVSCKANHSYGWRKVSFAANVLLCAEERHMPFSIPLCRHNIYDLTLIISVLLIRRETTQ